MMFSSLFVSRFASHPEGVKFACFALNFVECFALPGQGVAMHVHAPTRRTGHDVLRTRRSCRRLGGVDRGRKKYANRPRSVDGARVTLREKG